MESVSTYDLNNSITNSINKFTTKKIVELKRHQIRPADHCNPLNNIARLQKNLFMRCRAISGLKIAELENLVNIFQKRKPLYNCNNCNMTNFRIKVEGANNLLVRNLSAKNKSGQFSVLKTKTHHSEMHSEKSKETKSENKAENYQA